MVTLKRVDVFSAGKILALINIAIGLIVGVVYGLFLITAGLMFQGADSGLVIIFGVLAIIGLPIFYGVMGFILGLIMAAVYNFVASKFGGLELDIK